MRRATFAAAVAAAAFLVAPTEAAPTCSVPTKTLTFDCDDACSNTYAPCWRNTSRSATATSCPYECYSIYFSDSAVSNFVFLVPFSEKSNKAYATTDAASDDLNKYISKSADLLSTIDTLKLPPTATKVYVQWPLLRVPRCHQ